MPTPPHQSYPAQANRLLHILEAADRAVLIDGTPADRFLADWFRQHRNLGSKTRRLISNTLFSLCRWRGWLVPPGQPLDTLGEPDRIRAILLAHALDAEAIDPLCDWWATTLPAPIENLQGIGHAAAEEKMAHIVRWGLPDGLPAPTVSTLVPAWFHDELAVPADSDPTAFTQDCILSLQHRPPTWLRQGPGSDDAWGFLSQPGYPVTPLASHPETASCPAAISRAHLQSGEGMRYELQDLSSQCVGWIANPQPGELWWDACAGGGGKSLHLAALMKGQGHLWATDKRGAMLRNLQHRWKQIPVTGVRMKARTLNAAMDAPVSDFDGIVVDAPCSGVGTWSRNPDARWRMTADTLRSLVKTQAKLLDNTARHVRPGGKLVYAVCTLTRSETIEQAKTFERNHPEFTPTPFPHPLTGESCPGVAWIWPWMGPSGGMFVARWGKQG